MLATSILSSSINFLLKLLSFIAGKGSGTSSISSEISYALRLLRTPPHLVLDIGGNNGEYSAQLKNKYQATEIHIFEPSTKSFESLVNRFSQDSNTFINQLAVSNTSGTSTLFTNEYGSGLTSLVKRRLDHFNIGFEKTESVKLIRLEEYWVNVLKKRPIDIMKIDIEGHEFAALLGAGSAIKKIKIIQFEFGGCNIDSKTFFQDFWYFFQQNNFTIFRISPIGLIKIDKYSELDEVFLTTNYLALNNSY